MIILLKIWYPNSFYNQIMIKAFSQYGNIKIIDTRGDYAIYDEAVHCF